MYNLSSAKGWHLKICNGRLHFYFSQNTQQVSQEKIKKLMVFMRDVALGNGIYWFQVLHLASSHTHAHTSYFGKVKCLGL